MPNLGFKAEGGHWEENWSKEGNPYLPQPEHPRCNRRLRRRQRLRHITRTTLLLHERIPIIRLWMPKCCTSYPKCWLTPVPSPRLVAEELTTAHRTLNPKPTNFRSRRLRRISCELSFPNSRLRIPVPRKPRGSANASSTNPTRTQPARLRKHIGWPCFQIWRILALKVNHRITTVALRGSAQWGHWFTPSVAQSWPNSLRLRPEKDLHICKPLGVPQLHYRKWTPDENCCCDTLHLFINSIVRNSVRSRRRWPIGNKTEQTQQMQGGQRRRCSWILHIPPATRAL